MIRVKWTIHGIKGHGEWFPCEKFGILLARCHAMNKRYGAETHYVQYVDRID